MTRVALVIALFAALSAQSANATVCAKGVYRAGCAGPHGAVVGQRPYGDGRPYGHPIAKPYAVHCYWRLGVKVCR